LTRSALVAQAVEPAAEEEGATTAGVLLLLPAAEALGLAADVAPEPDAAGAFALPDDAQPASAAAQISAPAARTAVLP
jgi:hypothetical protein